MTNRGMLLFSTLVLSLATYDGHAATDVNLSSLDLTNMSQGWGKPQKDKSVRELPLSIAGKKFEHGVGTHAASKLWIDLAGNAERFQATVGLDDNANGPGSVNFQIYGDGQKLWESGIMRPGQSAKDVDLGLQGMKLLLLKVEPGNDGTQHDHADWALARFTVKSGTLTTTNGPKEEAVILTPKPGPEPRINGARVYGCRPGNPFLYRIPATGKRPMQFKAENLPAGLKLDDKTGIISGTAPEKGVHNLTLLATNQEGASSRTLAIKSGETLALTPYMGWNHWYAHYTKISDTMIRTAADNLLASGMADVGYDYVCIDDCWMRKADTTEDELGGPLRNDKGDILPNKRFPDMKKLTDYLHGKGFKAGIYTSPGPLTCAGYTGSYQHEAQDAAQFADWGFDLLKHDWCSYRKIVPKPNHEELMKPYELMGSHLAKQKRDIVYNLCQYGMGDVWQWGDQVHAHSWRTAGDLGYELDRIIQIARRNSDHRAWNGPGHWNDPDYLQIGYIGDARTAGELKPCGLTPNEQYAFVSLWSLMASPLVYSGDMTRLDEFTLNVLCNPEVIDINQDTLGQCGALSPLEDDCYVLVKELEDGSKAVGLCNGGEMETELTAKWPVLGLRGPQRVRDVWRHKDIGTFNDEYKIKVPRHAVALVRIWPQ